MDTIINLKDFLLMVKKERPTFFKNSFDRAYTAFTELSYDKSSPDFFYNNASLVVETMRSQCWNDFLIEEKTFTIEMMKRLISSDSIKDFTPEEAIEWFIKNFDEHLYQLGLSNTQSRRSRAGKEFENIIELILIGANLELDSQGNVGKDYFMKRNLGKLVDIVCPGVVFYGINKRNTILISAKTTLRERWQEVPEEMGRTGAQEMFLATLDDNISDEVLNTLYESNIQVTTTKSIKKTYYKDNPRVLTFEDLVSICKDATKKWDGFDFSNEQLNNSILLIEQQVEKHSNHHYLVGKYQERLKRYLDALK